MKDSIDHSDTAPAAIADERASMAFVALDRPRSTKPKIMNALTLRFTVLFTLAIVASAAHAQTMFFTSFEAPIYTNGVSAAGVYGWESGYYGGGPSKVTNARASAGSQSLFFDNSSSTGGGSLRQTLFLGATGTLTESVDVWLGGGSGSGRLAELRFTNHGGRNDYFVSVDGSGAVRMGQGSWYDDPTAYINPVGYALEGTYTDRWLRFTMGYNSATGSMTMRASGFGSGQSDLTTTTTGFTGGGYLELASSFNPSAANKNGTVYFDRVNVVGPNPVPEPASMAALGVGALGVAARRRRR